MQTQHQEEVPLSIQNITDLELIKGDIIFHQSAIWQCVSKQMQLFINLDTRHQAHLQQPNFTRIKKLQLIPKQWNFSEGRVHLKGQELGLGPVHEIQIEGMRSFAEMEVISSEAAKGRKIEYKVVLCQTALPKKYLLVAIQFL